jgi:hypothetical protein
MPLKELLIIKFSPVLSYVSSPLLGPHILLRIMFSKAICVLPLS